MRARKLNVANDDQTDFDAEFERSAKIDNGDAASAMLSRGRFIAYRERDTPAGHVVREYPDGTKTVVRISLEATSPSHT